jgi:hypothetical protein
MHFFIFGYEFGAILKTEGIKETAHLGIECSLDSTTKCNSGRMIKEYLIW